MLALVHRPQTRVRGRPASSRIAWRHLARLDIWTYVLGNALFWVLWGAISVSADHWYWWAAVPLAGWTALLAFHVARSKE